ncbi:MAG TPA: hypothetical protein VLC49_00940 [Solirubrobacteraceae bacterium]|nr:hypothetical protein [Solirubrobacteraceae bacterium]
MTAGVIASGELVTEKAPLAADDVLEGRDAGTTVPVWVDVLHRPWHSVEVEVKVERPVTAGRPFTNGVVPLVWALPRLSAKPDPIVGVVVASVDVVVASVDVVDVVDVSVVVGVVVVV